MDLEKVLKKVEFLSTFVEKIEEGIPNDLFEIEEPRYIAIFADDIFCKVSLSDFLDNKQDDVLLSELEKEEVPQESLQDALDFLKTTSHYYHLQFEKEVYNLRKDPEFPSDMLNTTLKILSSQALTAYTSSSY